MTTEELNELYERLFLEHGQKATLLFLATVLERLGDKIERANEE